MTGQDASASGVVRFDFAGNPVFRAGQAVLGITPGRCWVDVDDAMLRIRFGPWRIETPIANISCATVTGPYAWWKVVGGPRVSFVDNGVTFATSAGKGVCLEFEVPVPNVYPLLRRPHPGLTVTVADPDALLLRLATVRRRDDGAETG